jgi:glycerol-3-phosphate dehydrogenase (NAD(P)+)
MSLQRVGIIGAGAWGTALAAAARRAGRDVVLWARNPALAAAINKTHENAPYLPGVALDPEIRATGAMLEAGTADMVLLVVPAQHTRRISRELAPHLGEGCPVVCCSKGIEQRSGALMTEVLAETLPDNPVAVLSGPTFAIEVARGLPSAVALACGDVKLGAELVTALGSRTFRPYLSGDPVGAEIGGAVKNVMAIACGIVMGRGLGDNARAALITRGLAEVARFALAKGGRSETLMGLSGLGDLTLTCSAMQSRNFSLGVALGQGRRLEDVLAERHSVAEGVYTSAALAGVAQLIGVDMPIVAAVDAVLNRGAEIDGTIQGLLARPFKAEWI